MKYFDKSNSLSPYKPVMQDCLFISLVVVVSLSLYVPRLGFYSDDWNFLGLFSLSVDQSPLGLFRAFYAPEHVRMRPIQALYLTALYWLFGPHPLGYHLINAGVLVSNGLLFYLVLHELGQPRVLTLLAPMIYTLLPHYSTDRFWFAAFQATLSLALYFLSLYADLRGLRAKVGTLWGWKILSILSLILSTLAYEVVVPLFLLNVLLVCSCRKRLYWSVSARQLNWADQAMLLCTNSLALILVITFKVLTTTRLESEPASLRQIVWIAESAIIISYGFYGLGLPRIIWKILCNYPNTAVFAVGAVLALIIYGYCYRIVIRSEIELYSRMSMLRIITGGVIVFGLGCTIFLAVPYVSFTATGINNRIAIASAIGVALTLAGVSGWVSTLLPSARLRRVFFCVLVTLISTSGFLVNNTLARFWIAAYERQQAILTDVQEHFPTLPAGSSLILDGICPYAGPAIVFDSSWDLQGALWLFYGDASLQGNIITPKLQVREDGLYTIEYGVEYRYPYEKLFVYNFARKKSYRFVDAEAARSYFQVFNPDRNNHCPAGTHGGGVPVF